jgi:hypothetical protein
MSAGRRAIRRGYFDELEEAGCGPGLPIGTGSGGTVGSGGSAFGGGGKAVLLLLDESGMGYSLEYGRDASRRSRRRA